MTASTLTLEEVYDLDAVLGSVDDGTTQEDRRAAYETLLRTVRPAGPSPQEQGQEDDGPAAEDQTEEQQALAAAPGPQQERVLGLACDLLGRHAAVVPALAMAAMTALTAVLEHHPAAAAMGPARIKTANALAAVAAVISAQPRTDEPTTGPPAKEGLAALLAAESDGPVRRALEKARAALEPKDEQPQQQQAQGEDQTVQTDEDKAHQEQQRQQQRSSMLAAAFPSAAGGPEEDGEDDAMDVEYPGVEAARAAPAFALTKEGAERLSLDATTMTAADDVEEGQQQQQRQQQQQQQSQREGGRSPSRGRSRSRSYTRSPSRGRSRTRSGSRTSRSYSRSRSRGRSYTPGRSRSRSRGRSYSRSRSRSYSRSRSRGSYYSGDEYSDDGRRGSGSRGGGNRRGSGALPGSASSRGSNRENRPPRAHQGYGSSYKGGSGSSSSSSSRQQSQSQGGPRKEDGEATVEALREMLATLQRINEEMADHTGFLPDDLERKVNCPDPGLWAEVYRESGIRPNKSNRLYRSRILHLISYLERRLGLPLSRPPLKYRRFAGPGGRSSGPGSGEDGGYRHGGKGSHQSSYRHPQQQHGGSGGYRGDQGHGGARAYSSEGSRPQGQGREGRRGSWQDGRDGDYQQHHQQYGSRPSTGGDDPAKAEVEEQMVSDEPTPFLAIYNLTSDVDAKEVLRAVQEQSPHYKIAPWDIGLLRDSRKDRATAYVTLGNVKVAGAIFDGLDGRPLHGRKMRLGYTLGTPCRHVYVGGVRGLEDRQVEDALWEYGAVERVETAQGPRRDINLDYVFVTFESKTSAVDAVRDINRNGGRVRGGHTLRVTFRPFKGGRSRAEAAAGPPSPSGSGSNSYHQHQHQQQSSYFHGGRGSGGHGAHHQRHRDQQPFDGRSRDGGGDDDRFDPRGSGSGGGGAYDDEYAGGGGGFHKGPHHHQQQGHKPRRHSGDVSSSSSSRRQHGERGRGRSRSPAPSRGRHCSESPAGSRGPRRYSRSVSMDAPRRSSARHQSPPPPSNNDFGGRRSGGMGNHKRPRDFHDEADDAAALEAGGRPSRFSDRAPQMKQQRR